MFFGSIGLAQYLMFGLGLIAVGIFGIITNIGNIISYIFALELMFLGINLMLVSVGHFIGDVAGQGMVIWILSITAAEVVLILGMIIMHYKNHKSIDIATLNKLKELED